MMATWREDARRACRPLLIRLTLTVDPTLSGERISELADAVAATLRVLDGINPIGCGVEVLRPAAAADLARMVRAAFDPSARSLTTQDWRRWGHPACGGWPGRPVPWRSRDATATTARPR